MFSNLRFTACCLILLGTSLSYAQNVRVVVNARGDVTITGTANYDQLAVHSLESFAAAFYFPFEATPELLVTQGVDPDVVAPFFEADADTLFITSFDSTLEFEGQESSLLLLPRTSSSSTIRVNSGDGDDLVSVFAGLKSISCNLGRGDDELTIGGSLSDGMMEVAVDVATDVIIDAGPGSDQVKFDGVEVGRNVRVNLGAGGLPFLDGEFVDYSDVCVVNTCQISGSLSVNQTSGRSGFALVNSSVNSNTRVTLGTGSDVFLGEASDFGGVYVNLGPGEKEDGQEAFIDSSTVNGSLTLIGGAFQDELVLNASSILGNVNLNAGSGDDDCVLYECDLAENVVINSAAGDDELGIFDCELGGDVRLNTSVGDDGVDIFNVNTTGRGNWSVITGSGDDEVGIDGQTDLDTRRFSANLGAGDDSFTIYTGVDTQIGVPRVTGSVGFDTFLSDSDSLLLNSFEDVTNE